MPASHLVDEVIEALQSHPDPYWARQAAVRVLDEHESDPDECEMCAGFGYAVDRNVELAGDEESALEAATAWAQKARKYDGKTHCLALIKIITRLLEEG